MTNFDTARQALETSLGSSGSAMREHEKWSQSLEARLNKLKSTWQSLSQTFMSSDFLKSGLDLIIGFVDVIDTLIDKIGVLPTLIGLFGAGKFIMNFTKLGGAVKSFTDILDILKISFPTISKLGLAFFSNLKGAIATFIAALASGTGAITAFKAAFSSLTATMSLNPYLLAAAAAIGVVIAVNNKYKKSIEELAKKVEDVTTNYREQSDSLKKLKGSYDSSDVDSMVSKYGKLSKGVNELGENVSLTADEYSEYQGIVDTIASQIPSLVTGYNSQGGAILECKGSVEELTQAYRDLILEQNNLVLDSGSDIFKDFKNDLKQAGLYDPDKNITSVDGHLLELQKLLNLKGDDLENELLGNSQTLRISQLLEDNGIKRDVLLSGEKGYESYSEHIIRALKEDRAKVKQILEDASVDINEYAEELGTATEAYFSTAFLGGDGDIDDYSHFSERIQNVINQITSGFGSDFYAQFLDDENPYESLTKYYDDMLKVFDSLGDSGTKEFEAAFNLQTQFNNGEISYGEYIQSLKNAESLVDELVEKGLDKEVANQIKLTLDTAEIQNEYDALKKRLTSEEYGIKMSAKDAEKYLDGLTASEYQVAIDLIDDSDVNFNDFDSITELRKYIKEQAKFNEAMNFTIAMDVETESLTALNTAMAESVSGAGLSSEAIAALKGRYAELESEGYNLSAMFEETVNGIHLNKKAVNEFEQALASQKLSETQDNLNVLQDRYDELTTEINNCTDASERASLYTEQQSILDKINDLGTLASQYEGLTSAYNAWLNAEEAGSERDMYEKVIEGFETVGDEIKRGWIDDGTIKFLELMTGETDLATKSASQLKKIWDGLDNNIKNTSYSVSDFFTTDEDGNSTSTGVYNFLNALQELESSDTVSSVLGKQFKDIKGIEKLVEKKDGKIIGFNFDVVGGDEAIAEALGISEELVQIMLRAADDAGFVVTLDGNWTQFADLKNQAETSNDALKKLAQTNDDLKKAGFGDYDFDFGASSLETLEEELSKAKELLNNDAFKGKDGKFNIDAKGAKDALKIAETLQIAKNKLEEPAYMSIDTTKLQEDLQKPVEQLQEFERLTQERDLLNLTGEDTKRLKEIDGELDKIATHLSNLDEQTKIKLGIKGMTPEQIRKELENGTIEVPAQLTIEANMDKSLEDLLTLGLFEHGFITEKEAKIRLGIEVENKDDVNQEIEDEIKDGNDKTIKLDKKFKITAETSGIDKVEELKSKLEGLDGLDDKTIKTIATVIGQMDVDKLKTTLSLINPVHVQAIAEAIGKGDVEGLKTAIGNLHPTHVQAIAEALGYEDVDQLNAAIENLDPKTVEAVANAIGITDVESLKAAIDNVKGKDVEVNASTSGESKLSGLKSLIDSIKSKTVTITSWFKKITSGGSTINDSNGFSDVDGTANANGTAFAQGTMGRAFKHGYWGTKDSGVALGNELGMETIVRDGHYFTIGDGSAQFFKYKKGDIIFNHKQTEELFKHGKVTSGGGHGKVYANGTAFSKGTGGGIMPEVKSYTVKADTVKVESKKTETKSSSSKSSKSSTSSKSKTSTSSKSKSSSSSTKDDFEETFDWIEVKISRLERAIDRLNKKASGTWRTWSSRNKYLTSEISKVNEEINLQEKAYSAYMKEANSVGLSSSWKKKVQNGTLDISTVKDEKLAEKIKKYQEYYEKALACKDTVLELQDAEAELNKQKFDNIAAKYDAKIGVIDNKKAVIEQNIEQSQYTTAVSSIKGNNYKKLVTQEQNTIAQLEAKKKDLQAQLNKSVSNGSIKKYSEDWYAMREEIDATTLAIKESTTNISQYYSEAFDQINSKYDGILQGYDHTETMLNEYIAQAEAQGHIVSTKYYDKLISNEESNINQLKKQQADLVAARDEALESGAIKQNSQEWYRMSQEIDAVTQEIEKSETAVLEYGKAIRDIEWETFDLAQQRIANLNDEAEFFVELMSSKKLYDENGQLTDEGKATMGMHGQQYNTHMRLADNYGAEVARLNQEIEQDPYDQDLINRRDEMLELQRESILAAEQEKNAIRDLVEEGISLELEALQDRIDKQNESLQSAKD